MDKRVRRRFLIILVAVLACLLEVTGLPKNFQQLKQNLANRIHLGLDLKGGTRMILQVHVEDAVKVTAGEALGRLRDEMTTRKIPYAEIVPQGDTSILVKGLPDSSSEAFQSLMSREFSTWNVSRVPGDATARLLSLKPSEVGTIKDDALNEARSTIMRRIDALGLVGPEVADYGQGDYELVVQLPGVSDPTHVENVLRTQAMLELKLVRGGPFPSHDAALSAYGGILPPDSQVLPGEAGTSSGASAGEVWYVVHQVPVVTGSDLTSAEPGSGQNGNAIVNFTLNRDGATRFAHVTGANIGKNLAIVLDNRVVSAPVIDSQIRDRGEIRGSFTPQQAATLALELRSGALPASISVLFENTVGPSLGADSIRHGIVASLVGFIAIISFMLIYYRGAGINADVALILNLVILVAAFVYFGAVLTLPGIAGVILTVGMGVDSNVLIFERIREELRLGKAPGAAVAGGFEHAFVTIIDTHVTTIASAAILYSFGSGPVKGFAVTLTIGLMANLFTSVFVSRTIFDYVLARRQKGAAVSI